MMSMQPSNAQVVAARVYCLAWDGKVRCSHACTPCARGYSNMRRLCAASTSSADRCSGVLAVDAMAAAANLPMIPEGAALWCAAPLEQQQKYRAMITVKRLVGLHPKLAEPNYRTCGSRSVQGGLNRCRIVVVPSIRL